MAFTTLEGQPEFPYVDISEGDAAILELLLQNLDILRPTHENAESTNRIYMLSHAAFELLARKQFDHEKQATAFSHGITTYEAIATLAKPSIAVAPSLATIATQFVHTHQSLAEEIVDTVVEARGSFERTLPRTVAVIGESATRYYRGYQDYAIGGTAVARQFEVTTTR